MAGKDSQAPPKAAVFSFAITLDEALTFSPSINTVYVIVHFRAMMMHTQTRAMRGMKATTARAKGKFPCLPYATEKIMHDLFLC